MINVQWIKLSEPWHPTLCASLEACGGGETSPDGKSSWRNPGSLQRGVDIEAVSKLGRISFALPGVTESALGPRPGETVFPPAASPHLSDNGGSDSRVLSGKLEACVCSSDHS